MESGSLAPEKTTYWMLGGRRTVPAYSRLVPALIISSYNYFMPYCLNTVLAIISTNWLIKRSWRPVVKQIFFVTEEFNSESKAPKFVPISNIRTPTLLKFIVSNGDSLAEFWIFFKSCRSRFEIMNLYIFSLFTTVERVFIRAM